MAERRAKERPSLVPFSLGGPAGAASAYKRDPVREKRGRRKKKVVVQGRERGKLLLEVSRRETIVSYGFRVVFALVHVHVRQSLSLLMAWEAGKSS